MVNENYFKTSHSNFRPSTKISEFGHVKFPESISPEESIACVIGGSQYNYRHRGFPLSNNYLVDAFTFKELLGLVKT